MSEAATVYPYGIFCDFDGTIAQTDMVTSIMREFAPATSPAIMQAIVSGEETIKRGVERLFAELPSQRFAELRDYANAQVKLRPGFAEFVALCAERGWLLVVVSGGFDFFVEPALRPFRDHLQVFCNRLDTREERLRVEWSVPCESDCPGGCGLCKPSVMARFAPHVKTRIVIGDGVTDKRMAERADFVFARDRLLQLCEQSAWPHQAFSDFYDVAATLRSGAVSAAMTNKEDSADEL